NRRSCRRRARSRRLGTRRLVRDRPASGPGRPRAPGQCGARSRNVALRPRPRCRMRDRLFFRALRALFVAIRRCKPGYGKPVSLAIYCGRPRSRGAGIVANRITALSRFFIAAVGTFGVAFGAAAQPTPGRTAALAFPGAVGWAAATPGGRGGRIIKVTTLAGDGAGSLRAALEVAEPRIIVFEVGGVIDLQRRTLRITQPNVTIAGQTAPSPGITLIQGGIDVLTHDVVMQHIRVRPGEAGQAKGSGWGEDALSTQGGA